MKINQLNSSLSFCVGTLFFATIVLSSPLASATVTTTTVNISESCTMTSINDVAHTATLMNGTYSGTDYTTGIGQTTLKTFCNDNAGYAIYAIGYTNDTYGNTKLHWNKATSTSDTTNDINTGIYTSGSTINSTWSMKLASVNGTYITTIANGTNNTENFTTWHVIPESYTKVAYNTSNTDMEVNGSGEGSSITVTYDSYISAGQPAGAYVGKVKYTLVHPNTASEPIPPLDSSLCPTNSICYAPNASDIIGSMSSLPQTTTTLTNASPKAGAISATVNSTTTLIAPNYKREGYGFAGWSTDFTATSSSTIYGPNETISTDPSNGGLDVSGGIVLYPVWIASSGNLQSWSGCSDLTQISYDDQTGALTATLSSITALTDTRDNNVYTVARLADGECWMVENLRLNNEHTTSSEDIAKARGYGTSVAYGNFIGLADSEDANFYNVTIGNTLYSTDGSNDTINIGTGSYPGYRIPRYNNNNTDMAIGATNSDGTTTLEDKYNTYGNSNDNHLRWVGYGNYYNWPAAMANTAYYSSYGASDVTGTTLCPLGWNLPLGGTSSGILSDGASDDTNRVGGFSYLDRMMGGTGQSSSTNSVTNNTMSTYWRRFPNNFVYSGSWSDALAGSRSSIGYYWSSSAYDYGRAYYMYFNSSGVYPGTTNGYKYIGLSVRCVADF